MKPKYATPAVTPCGASSTRRARPVGLDRGLAHRVRRGHDAGEERIDRRDHDDVAAPRDDLRQRGLDGVADAVEVDREDAVEALTVLGEHGADLWLDTGVGHDDVKPAEALDRRGHGTLEVGAIDDVELQAERAALAQRGGLALGRLAVEVSEHHAPATCVEPARRVEADAVRAAGQEDGCVHATYPLAQDRRGQPWPQVAAAKQRRAASPGD
jgi:hypothetical protein